MQQRNSHKDLEFHPRGGSRARMPRRPSSRRDGFGALIACLAATGAAHAGYVTQPESQLDRIFSQPSFGAQRVDVRFNARQTLYSSALANVDTSGDVGALFARATSPTSIYAFYVDAVNWCGSYATAIIGCGEWPGNAIVIESNWAASTYGSTLIAHEAGHNLGLGHVSGGTPNLMNGTLGGSTALTSSQVSRILSSPLVQWRDGLRTLSITPIAVVASGAAYAGVPAARLGGATAVPEPPTTPLAAVALALAALFGLGRERRRR